MTVAKFGMKRSGAALNCFKSIGILTSRHMKLHCEKNSYLFDTSPHIFQQRIILARWRTALFDIFVHISYYVHRYFILLFQHDA